MNQEIILQVSEFNELIQKHLDLLDEVIVEGEISQIKVSGNKWLFLTIKDDQASLRVFGVVFKIKNHPELAEGMKVKVVGHPRLYQKDASFSLFANAIYPSGEGALKIAFEKLCNRLTKEGLFDPDRKRPIPEFPENIGLITAPDSQAYADFVKVLRRRMGGLTIFFYPVFVQGQQSASSILRAFSYLNTQTVPLDVIALVRGGGSLEDLSSFNDEQVIRAIVAGRTPVVCGVGHENDLTLADLAADLRASTPSNAAELIVRDRNELFRQINSTVSRIKEQVSNLILNSRTAANYLIFRIGQSLSRRLESLRRYRELSDRLVLIAHQQISQRLARVTELERLLHNLDYHRLLKRGFSITLDAGGKVIRSIAAAEPKAAISSVVIDGRIQSTVTGATPSKS